MATIQTVDAARALLGGDVLGPEEIAAAFGVQAASGPVPAIAFTADDLQKARSTGQMLVLRSAAPKDGSSLTIQRMIQDHPEAFETRLLRKVGYQLKDEWGIELEPSAAVDTCTPGWALVHKTPLAQTLNLSYEGQEAVLESYAAQFGASASSVRRRTAVEIVYDSILYFVARQTRLLAKSWDWSSTQTVDGGYLNVGGFGNNGMQILSYSRAVRHGALGICPTRGAQG